MVAINQLSATDIVAAADLVPVFSQTSGDARKASMTVLSTFIKGQITSGSAKITQFAAPSATGFTVLIGGTGQSMWLVLTPTGTLAAGTITLPLASSVLNGQEFLMNSTQAITALTIGGNGATVTGAPTTIAANGFFLLRFESVTQTWYRVG